MRVRVVLAAMAVVAVFAGAAEAAPRYTALGDSFAAGPLIPNPVAPLGCLKSSNNYGRIAQRTLAFAEFRDATCSGAETEDMFAPQNVSPDGPNPPQLDSLSADTRLVTLTIGGNDIGFANLIYQCTLSDCSSSLDGTRASLATVLAAISAWKCAAIRDRAAFGARVAVLGYPRIFGSTGCFGTLGISTTERTKANQLADALDAPDDARAAAAGLSYASALAPFTGHAVCSSGPWLNGLNVLATTESYHPNRNGQAQGYVPLARVVVG